MKVAIQRGISSGGDRNWPFVLKRHQMKNLDLDFHLVRDKGAEVQILAVLKYAQVCATVLLDWFANLHRPTQALSGRLGALKGEV